MNLQNPEIIAKIATKLKQLRIEKGYTSYENFAMDFDLSRAYYWKVERGRQNLSMDYFYRCSKFMKSHLKISFLILISLISHSLLSQKEAAIWYFGDSAGLDFNTIPASSLTNSKMYALESSGTIADTNGNLLFYTDGQTVWNKNHEIMQGGTNLEGSENASQNGLIVNHPDNDSLYYVFLTPYSYNYMNGLKYCVVNIKANNGNGKVIEKNVLLHSNSSEKVSAVYHANGRDIWLIGHEWGNNNFYLYLLTSKGFNHCPVVNSVGIEYKKSSIFTDGIFVNQGFIKFSPNSKYMAHVFTPTDPLNIFSELYRFDKTNGHLELFSTIPMTVLPWGTEFSSNNENLFIGRRDSPVLVLNIPSLQSKTIDSLILPYSVSFQLSIDSNIYFGVGDSTFVGTINGNDFGNIHVNKKAINLSKGKMQYGLPNIFVGYLTHNQPRIHYQNKCNGGGVDFEIVNVGNINKWVFEHQNLSNWFERSEINPNVTFTDTGLWLVRCILTNNDTISTNVFIETEVPLGFLGTDMNWCENLDTSITLKAPSGMHCYEWNTGETSSEIVVNSPGTYIAKITTNNFCVLYDTVVISADSLPNIPIDFLGENISWCENLDTLVVLSAPNDMLFYEWNTGSNNQQIQTDSAGIYWVTVTAHNNCVFSDTVQVSLDSLPDIETDFLGNDFSWCENIDTSIILKAPDSMFQYLWNTGDTTQEIETDIYGKYWVKVVSHNFCILSDTILLSIDEAPIKPIIEQKNDTLQYINYSGGNIVWSKNGVDLQDTSIFLILTANGIYGLRVINEHGCISESDSIIVDNISTQKVSFRNFATVYPNPVGDILHIEFKGEDFYNVFLIDATGKTVYNKSYVSGDKHAIDVRHLSTGVYLIKLTNGSDIYLYRIVKI